jgi:5-methylthioadenosine/S-adenosylhomocysteine deaminase
MDRFLLNNCRYLVPNADNKSIIEYGSVVVEGKLIKEIGLSDEINFKYKDDLHIELIDCTDKIVMPGLIDAHNHLTVAHHHLPLAELSDVDGGIEDEMLNQVWPAYVWLDDDNSYDLILWSMLHNLKHGVTTSTHAGPFPYAGYRAAEFSKTRMVIHPLMVTSVHLSNNLDEKGYLKETEEVIKNYNNSLDGLVSVGVHASWPWNCTQNLLVKGMELAHKYDVQFTTHLFEAPDEVKRANTLWADQGGAIQYLDNLGLITDRSLFFHAANLNEKEIDLFAVRGASIVHNPECNAGAWNRSVAYVPYYLDAGVTVGLGSDGAPRDMFGQMMLTQYLHNVMPREKNTLDSSVPFRLATEGSAIALRLDKEIGTLEAGKRADMIAIDLESNTSLGVVHKNTLFKFINNGNLGNYVSDVMVDGIFLLSNNEFTIFDEEAITARMKERLDQYVNWYEAKRKSRPGRTMIDLVHEEFIKI